MKAQKSPVKITEKGVSAIIREASKLKDGKTLKYFIVEYILLGKRKQVWRSNFDEARTVASDACVKVANGDQSSLELRNGARIQYAGAIEALLPFRVQIDTACREYADALKILDGKASIAEACREWVKRNAVTLPKITLADAGKQLQRQAIADGKSCHRLKQLSVVINRLAESFNVQVDTVTPDLISAYLSALPMAERSKRNHRDVIGFFNRWLVLRGYLSKGTDWLEGVQNYTARKLGEIEILTADEMRRLIAAADEKILPLIVIGGFAGLRHAEIARLEWQDIDFSENYIEVKAQHAKTKTRRIVPMKPNLKAFLMPLAKKNGKVVSIVNTSKYLLKAAAATGDTAKEIKPLTWRHNALRHTYISARVAESGDVARAADEAGNSPQVIRTNYLKRIRPAAAAEWFSIAPDHQ
jgi:integrase